MTMESPRTIDRDGSDGPSVGSSVPVAFLKKGEYGKVVMISGKKEIKTYLEGLGFIRGTPVRIVNHDSSGHILEVKGSRIAIDDGMAMKIMVSL